MSVPARRVPLPEFGARRISPAAPVSELNLWAPRFDQIGLEASFSSRRHEMACRSISGKSVRFFCVALSIAAGLARAQSGPSSEPDIEQLMARFLTAFDNLDWPVFRSCFSVSPTVFFPLPQVVRRVEGEQFDKVWQAFFDQARKRATGEGRKNPPFLDIKPKDLRIDRLTDDVAVVTLHLGTEPRLNRRTIVLQKFSNGWKIVHVHASYLAPE
jgi:SnoaL-like domain